MEEGSIGHNHYRDAVYQCRSVSRETKLLTWAEILNYISFVGVQNKISQYSIETRPQPIKRISEALYFG